MAAVNHLNEQPSAPPAVEYKAVMNQKRRRMWWGLLFLSPWLIGFVIFYLIPMGASFIFTFTEFDLTRPQDIEFVGLANWQRLVQDQRVGQSLVNTGLYALVALPLTVVIPVIFAALLNAKHLWGKRWMRTLFYLPYMVPTVSAAFIWDGFLNPETGWLNMFLRWLNLPAPNWLYDAQIIYVSLFLISLWGLGNAMLITLASMQGVPTELYEAADVDGASAWMKFRNITLPLISPVIFYNLVLTTIALFRYFDIPYMLKGATGDPAGSTLFYNILLYREAFRFQNMGYGSTLAWLLFALALVATLILFLTARHWVYYGAERGE